MLTKLAKLTSTFLHIAYIPQYRDQEMSNLIFCKFHILQSSLPFLNLPTDLRTQPPPNHPTKAYNETHTHSPFNPDAFLSHPKNV